MPSLISRGGGRSASNDEECSHDGWECSHNGRGIMGARGRKSRNHQLRKEEHLGEVVTILPLV